MKMTVGQRLKDQPEGRLSAKLKSDDSMTTHLLSFAILKVNSEKSIPSMKFEKIEIRGRFNLPTK